ncbi:MAG: hypothetical protein DI552_14160 [Brevundimonas sp.]|uniref:Lipoprotein n=1 Tax=Brevundimonas albigilva TaxID=1312364 RepID=A0ABY4SSF1_9CAUL|nr:MULTISPECIES: hypothetical protein [Brevundimonas]PZU53050.1 MAG: hypothetical protein DI552_14160 [Brevundimonas sp.]UQV18497.1 hypothetical protein MU852_00660 [Brevundimonas albigilva]URI16681.1 hypothetical protein M8231_06860 [Brevundimonas albigilva]
MRASISILTLAATGAVLGGCAADPRMPESGYQWERRQDRIEQEWRARQAKAAPAQPTSTNGAPAPEDRF